MAATWGTNVWGANSWESETVAVSLTGFSVTSSLGTLAYAQSVEGWGRDTWGSNQWGEDATDVSLTGLEMTGGLGPDAWGEAPWNEQIGWGGTLKLTTTQLTIAALTGIEITGSLGTPTISRLDMNFDITGPAAMGAGLGVPNINDGADHSQGVGSLLATGSLGSLSHEMTYELGSLSATGSIGSITITSAKIYVITATNLATASLGSVTTTDMAVGLSGIAMTGSLGSFSITDMQIGVSGLEITATLNPLVSPLHYRDDTITGSTSYTSVDITGSTSYTIDEHAA
jgi:hypothetical protein